MIEAITAFCAGAIANIASSITIGSTASAIVGNRADALFMRVLMSLSGAFDRTRSRDHDTGLVPSILAAYRASLEYHLETLAGQCETYSDRTIVDALHAHLGASFPSKEEALPEDLISALSNVLTSDAYAESNWNAVVMDQTVRSVAKWCEAAVGVDLPVHFMVLLTRPAPNGRKSWFDAFRQELARVVSTDDAFARLFVSAKLSEILGRELTAENIANTISRSVDQIVKATSSIERKVDHLVEGQARDSANIAILAQLLVNHYGYSRESSERLLGSHSFQTASAPSAIVYVKAFGNNNVRLFGRRKVALLIAEIGRRLEKASSDMFVRHVDGDDFIITLPPALNRDKIVIRADEIMRAVSGLYLVDNERVLLEPLVSVARAPRDGLDFSELERSAQFALENATPSVPCFFEPEMRLRQIDRTELEADLSVALAEDSLHLVYQPSISCATGELTGYEALLRWQHPTRGMISPAVFVPMAEDAGLISMLDDWALRRACFDAASWPSDLRIAVNVSPRHFATDSFPAVVERVLAESGLSPRRLELEVTEGSVLFYTADEVSAKFAKLKSLGLRLVLDDFGTGFSSFSYLRRISFDKFKIDKSFVDGGLDTRDDRSAIIKSIVSLAKALSVEAVAEGVETKEQFEFVRALGCDEVQGFFIGRPVPSSQIASALEEERRTEMGVAVTPFDIDADRVTIIYRGESARARISSYSATGGIIENTPAMPEGAKFSICLNNSIILEAEVLWSLRDRLGVRFLDG
ncbi:MULTISPECIES: putative bifunctional diguanylate cyclase/phosphodiesterase [unclassified Sphingobium]|uniref:putative bifunctional diguanylate cyclase/phosphodiesterase n=1 Tax=unclassified Sphingobium TaxID=2611147 RepID=UPI0022247094|nr:MULTISPECIES: GGDEF domain-containing phosphodiesterase [unclassified Sphingobium]MCW2410893.1 EAL domain-containing protein (putative c-di-GMP-specific phosphodiesterase class I) [Sphingobium sp. B8D3D]MCW2416816.1 EAL domain-containing protein (putative c-di-GMP-specific phosphodiesterase class I) [Sphingobium sp. B8D3A]